MMKKMIFLFNPRSGKEAIKNQLSDILGIFCRAGYLPSVYVTQEPGAIPVFSCLQGYIPVRSPKREGVLVAEVA